MFNNGFYPTPASIVRKMIGNLQLENAYILEPSAGKGDILDVIQLRYERNYHAPKLYAIEINPDLRGILRGKGYSLVGEDFLQYQPLLHFTHIIMNPPFDQAERHLLHAWNILYAGEIVCLLPATVLEAKTVQENTISKLIADHGSYESLGKAFATAERPTNVEVILVRLKKTAAGSQFDFDVQNDRVDPTFTDGPGRELALNGFIASLLASYNASIQNYAAYVQARQMILRLTQPLNDYFNGEQTIDIVKEADSKKMPRNMYNAFVDLLTQSAWTKLMSHPGFQNILTERARKMMQEFRARQKRVDFNSANIEGFFAELIGKTDEIMLSAVLDAFDTMTEHHEENRIYFEGWKSNKAWKVNHKVVLPYFILYDQRFGGPFSLRYEYINKLNDIDRALCVVSKLRYEDVLTAAHAIESYLRYTDNKRPAETESTFFACRWFKKGTLHLTFKDRKLLDEFNLMACRGRNWLPPGKAWENTNRTPGWQAETKQEALF